MSRPAQPHGPLTEVFPDVFVVTGSFRVGPGARIPRNMTVVRQGKSLTLVNAIRLTTEGEEALGKLGTVEHIVRLGAGHGSDDGYLASRYHAPVWAARGMPHAKSITETRELSAENHPLPAGTQVYVFQHGKYPEAVVVLPSAGGVLVACDCYQNWASYDGASLIAKIVLWRKKFGPTIIGPMWFTAMGPDVVADLRAMRDLTFRHLISGHGAPLRDTAKEGLDVALAKAGFGTTATG